MISYFIVPHCMFTTNVSRKLKSQFQVIFGQNSFLLKVSPFQVSLVHSFTNCLLANGWWNTCFYHYSFLQKCFPSLLASAWFVVRYFSFVEQTVLVVFPDYSFVTTKSPIFFSICLHRWLLLNTSSMISYLIFLNKFFLHLDADSASY